RGKTKSRGRTEKIYERNRGKRDTCSRCVRSTHCRGSEVARQNQISAELFFGLVRHLEFTLWWVHLSRQKTTKFKIKLDSIREALFDDLVCTQQKVFCNLMT